MDPIAKTAWYCCGIRAADAVRPRPICGDHLAARFMAGEGEAVFRRFARFRGPNASNVARHRMIDDWLRERLQTAPDLRIVLLGAGFDTRAFRLAGGRWLELDQPALMAFKETRLPIAEAPNPLDRVAIDFARGSLADTLAPWAGDAPAAVVLEGVSMYLEPAALQATLDALKRSFPRHWLVCDLMTAAFARSWSAGLRREIAALGGQFAAMSDDPAAAVTASGYRELAHISIVDRARELGALRIPRSVLATVLRSLRDGYRLHVFEAPA
ncbi:MAG TPA: SAM-dependent methyltransferase [Stellaceae bacterium]|nr:SAM-dependent methyltransferase [Stellaceae bacterium]